MRFAGRPAHAHGDAPGRGHALFVGSARARRDGARRTPHQSYLRPAARHVFILPAAAATAVSRLDEYSTGDDVLRWINSYRERPDPAAVPTAIKLLSWCGVLRDPDSAGVYVGFLAGIRADADAAEPLAAKVLSGLPAEDQWIVVRAIAYSELPQWKALLREFAPRMPTRAVMIERYLADRLPTLERVRLEPKKPAWTEKLRGMFLSDGPKHDELTFDSDPRPARHAVGLLLRDRKLPAGSAHHRHAALVQGQGQRRPADRRQHGQARWSATRPAAPICSPCSSAPAATSPRTWCRCSTRWWKPPRRWRAPASASRRWRQSRSSRPRARTTSATSRSGARSAKARSRSAASRRPRPARSRWRCPA